MKNKSISIENDVRKRVVFIDLLRIIACFFVIVNHTIPWRIQGFSPSLEWFASLIYFLLQKLLFRFL